MERPSDKIDAELTPLFRKIADGKVVLFLGAGANDVSADQEFPPFTDEEVPPRLSQSIKG